MAQVLVVEDDETLARALTDKLTSKGFTVVVKGDGAAAISQATDRKPDLLILDVMLPGDLNGFDVLEEVKRRPDLSSVPVIVLTNLDSEEKIAMQVGANVYMVKAESSLDSIVNQAIQLLKLES